MGSTPEARIGVAGEISGFVVAEDQSLRARLARSLALGRQDLTRRTAHLQRMVQGKAGEFRDYLVALRVARQGNATPEVGSVIEPLHVGEASAADLSGIPVFSAPRRLKRLAGVLALYWHVRVVQMRITERLSRLDRYRLSVATLAILGSLALGAALLLPDAEAPPVAVMPIVEQALPILPAATEASILSPMVASAKAAKAEDVWLPVKRPVLLYNLEAPDVEASSLVYRVAMRGKSARQDMLTWVSRGQAGAGKFKPAVHLVVERFEQTSPTFRPLYSDIANRAAEQGISIDRMTPPQEIQTKFGSGQVADAVLSTEQGPLGCLVFRQIDTIGLVFAGWYCGSAQRPADRVSLICFIDRLDLLGAGQDAALKKHFAGAERNRKSCAGARQSGRKLTWLDHEAPMPPLKLSAKAR